MAENRHVQHLRSKVVESNGKPKLPSSSVLTFGEIAVNYAENVETLSIKNESGNVVTFSSDDYYTKEKLGTAFTNSDKTVTDGLNEKVNNNELNDKIADAIATADTVSGAIETIVNDKLTAYSSATEIEEALSGKSDVGHHHEVADIDDFESGVETVVSSSETITERIESVVASAITNNESVSASVESVISAFTEEALDDRYAFKEHTHEASAITDFNSAVEGIVSTSSTITERIENVVASAITNNESVSASVSTIVEEKLEDYSTTQEIETILEDYAKKGQVDKVSEFINDVSYVTSGQVEPMVAAAISGSDTVISAITEILSDNSGITEVINNVVSGQIEGAVSGKADTSAMTLAIEEATSGKADSDDVHEWIEAATSGKVDNNAYTAYTAATEAVLSGKADASDIPSVTEYADAVAYDSSTQYMKFYHGGTGGTMVYQFDASPFLIDGMVESVVITSVTSGASEVEVLQITWNSAAGSQVTYIPLSDIFDPANYYTKDEIDDIVSGINATIEDNERVVSSALNDLNDRIDEKSDFDGKSSGVTAMTGYQKAAQYTAVATSDTLNEAIGKLEKGIESAASGGVNDVSLDSGTTSGSLRLIVNETPGIDVFVPGLGSAAFKSVGSGNTQVAAGDHHHTASQIDDFDDAVADGISGNSTIINAIAKSIEVNPTFSGSIMSAVTSSTEYQTLSADVYTIGDNLDNLANSLGSAAYEDANAFASSSHTHTASQITDFNTAIANSISGNSSVINSITKVITGNSNVSGSVIDIVSNYTYDKDTIDEKVAAGGTFDPTQYYTTAQTDNLLAGKSGTGHTHPEYANQNAFSVISANGSTITADNTGDTLTLSGDSFININVNNGTSGSDDRAIFTINTGATSGTVAVGNHTHTTTIATSTATNQINLAFGSKYALSAGGTSYVFTMPSTSSTWTNNYYTTGLTVSTATTSNTITVKGNNTSVTGTAVLSGATTSAAGLMTSADKTALNNLNPLSGKVSTLSAITATSTAINSLTGSVGTMAYQNTSSYSSATQVNTALAGKSNTGHTHSGTYATNAFSKIKINAESTTIDADSTGDTLTISGGTFITLTRDSTNDKLTINVPTGTTNATVAVGNHTHSASTIEGFDNAVMNIISSNTSVKNEIISAVTASTQYSTLSGDVYTISGTADAAKAVTDFYIGHNPSGSTPIYTLANIPKTKRLVIVTLTGTTTAYNNVSISGGSLPDGYEVHVMIKNTTSSDVTITYPTASPYVNTTNDTGFVIKTNGTGELNFISDGTNIYMRGA